MKRIVICADGTWNERDTIDQNTGKRHPTNVTKVARAIKARDSKGIDQLVYYHNGVGTGGGLDKYSGGAFGDGLEANVADLYRFIAYNYEAGDGTHPPDELYFFGFSRGAFTVRTLAGLLKKVDLLEKDDDYYFPEAFNCYVKQIDRNSNEWRTAFHNVKNTRPCPSITFIGVWDTVGSLGAPGVIGQIFNRDKYKFHDIGLGPHISHAYHALAIDEHRKPFLPSLWARTPDFTGDLEQAWFPGVHSGVGGSYHPDGLANEALHWMVGKAEQLGLEFDDAFLRHYRPCFNSTLQDSMSTFYRLMGPVTRTIGANAADGECIHQAAIDRMKHAPSNYAPQNLKANVDGPRPLPVVDTTRIPRGTPC